MKDLGIFIYIGNIEKSLDLLKYLNKITINFSLFISFCTELVSEEDINKTKEEVLKIYPKAIFFYSENQGCDIGPLFLFLNYLRKKKLKFRWIMHLHTKTDDDWRQKMLNDLIPENYDIFWKNINVESKKYVGTNFKYSYDYVNFSYDIDHLEKLGLEMTTDWNKYKEIYKETKDYGIVERVHHALRKKEHLQYVPHIDKESVSVLFGDFKNILPGYIWNIMRQINYDKISRLFYFPGTFFMCRHKSLEEIFCNLDFKVLYSELEKGKLDDRYKMSRTHSWERVIPIAFQLKFGENCYVINEIES